MSIAAPQTHNLMKDDESVSVALETVTSALESASHIDACLVSLMRLHGAIPPELELSPVYLSLVREQLERYAREQGLEL